MPISILALILSAVSVIHSCGSSESADQGQVQKAVDDALKVREKKFVDGMKPRFRAMFAEMGDESGEGWNPGTIEELIEPLARIINNAPAE